MTEESLFRAFCEARLPKEDWTHRAHLRVALTILGKHAYAGARALDELRHKIQHLNLAHGVETTPGGGYHETRTRVWLAVLLQECQDSGFCEEEIVGRYASRDVCLEYYSSETLASWEARTAWLPPEKGKLGIDPGAWGDTPSLFSIRNEVVE